MTVLETMVRFAAAWLAVGLGMFVASGAIRVVLPALSPTRHAPAPPAARVLALVPFLVGLALVVIGLVQFVQVVPW